MYFLGQFFVILMLNEAQYTENEMGCPISREIAANTHLFRCNIVKFHYNSIRQNMRDICRYTVLKVRGFRQLRFRIRIP